MMEGSIIKQIPALDIPVSSLSNNIQSMYRLCTVFLSAVPCATEHCALLRASFATTPTVLLQLATLLLLQSIFIVSSPFMTTGLLLVYTKWVGLWLHFRWLSQYITWGTSCVSVSELACHPSCQPFQQCLFHLGGHIPEVFPAHRRKCPSSPFFKSWWSHPFPSSQVMTTAPEANCGNSA